MQLVYLLKINILTIRLSPNTHNGNRHIMVIIYHCSKWLKAKAITKRDTRITTKFLEHKIIYRFGIPRYILINNTCE
jgi:hypothetical protein